MNYTTIYRASLADGEGWRVVLFVSGCDHKCVGCHNEKAQDPNYGAPFTDEVKEELFSYINDAIDGLTLSGGDPLYKDNIADVTELCKEFKKRFPTKNIWLYTGSEYADVKDLEVMKYIDYIVDGEFILAERNTALAFRGSENQHIYNVHTGMVYKGKK